MNLSQDDVRGVAVLQRLLLLLPRERYKAYETKSFKGATHYRDDRLVRFLRRITVQYQEGRPRTKRRGRACQPSSKGVMAWIRSAIGVPDAPLRVRKGSENIVEDESGSDENDVCVLVSMAVRSGREWIRG